MCYTQPSSVICHKMFRVELSHIDKVTVETWAELEEEQERELCPEAHSGSIYSTEANKHILTCGWPLFYRLNVLL